VKSFDLLLCGGTVVTEGDAQVTDIAVGGGKILEVRPDVPGAAREEIDATGLHVFPGLLDAHVHFNEPGRADWEGIETGSRALAAGGGTLFIDMPLNAHPPTVDREGFDLKLWAANADSAVDFAFWGGLVPDNLDRLEELAEAGVVGFKAFMADSGTEDFLNVDDQVLREGMKRAAKLRLPVAVHAESDAIVRELTRDRLSRRRISVRDFLESRPIAAELDAIQRAVDLAGETGCALHVVHVSSGEGIRRIVLAQKAGVDVSCETCPHYLALTERDMEELGAIAKCAPPLRTADVQAELWQRLLAGQVTTVGSDHSPSPPEMKAHANFFTVWGGISGVQETFPLLITEGHVKRNMALPLIAQLTSFNVARRFRLPAKGRIAPGFDADFAVADLREPFTLRTDDLFCRHRQSPYVGRSFRGRIQRTIVRGETVFHDGKIIAKPRGRLVKPLL